MDRDEAARELEVSPSPLDRMVRRGEYLGLGAEHGREQAAHRRARRRVARLGVAVAVLAVAEAANPESPIP